MPITREITITATFSREPTQDELLMAQRDAARAVLTYSGTNSRQAVRERRIVDMVRLRGLFFDSTGYPMEADDEWAVTADEIAALEDEDDEDSW